MKNEIYKYKLLGNTRRSCQFTVIIKPLWYLAKLLITLCLFFLCESIRIILKVLWFWIHNVGTRYKIQKKQKGISSTQSLSHSIFLHRDNPLPPMPQRGSRGNPCTHTHTLLNTNSRNLYTFFCTLHFLFNNIFWQLL